MSEEITIEQLPEVLAKTEDLPSLPTVAMEVLRLSRDPDASMEDLSKAISMDPALTTKILKLANSSHFRRGAEVTTLSKATVMLGMKTVKLMALSFSLTSKLNQTSEASSFDFVSYWRHSLAMAVTGRSLARFVKNRNGDEAFLCGLLGHLGQLVMANAIPDMYAGVLEKSPSPSPSAKLEAEVLGFNHHQVSAALLKSWELPDLICHAIRFWGNAEALPEGLDETTHGLIKLLVVSHLISTVICDAEKGPALQKLHEVALEFFGLTEEEIDTFVIGLQEGINETAKLLNVDLDVTGGYDGIIADARTQMVQISLGTAMDLHATESRAQQLEEENKELETQANTDKLTQVPNRAAFEKSLEKVVKARLAGESKNALGILVMDVDKFKSFNDTYGHQLGDEVLKAVASWIRESTRTTDFAARYGGEEFVVIVPNTTVEDLKTVAERIRTRVEAGSVPHGDSTLSVTISIGGACVAQVSSDKDGTTLVGLADECLYEAKEGGRNQTICKEVELVAAG